MNKAEILVIDDELPMQKLLEITLGSNDYKVMLANTGRSGIIMAANHPPDLVLLDLGLPDINGHEVLKQLREWYTNPVIILSVQSNEEDIVTALDNGANDYLVKPFRTGELLARIRSCLRGTIQENMEPIFKTGDLEINLYERSVKRKGELVRLTATEYSLLALLVKNEGRVLTHQFLLREVWGPGFLTQSQYLRVFVAQLRKKLETDPNRPKHIITESGVGYRFLMTA